jgi:hypothetical protein
MLHYKSAPQMRIFSTVLVIVAAILAVGAFAFVGSTYATVEPAPRAAAPSSLNLYKAQIDNRPVSILKAEASSASNGDGWQRVERSEPVLSANAVIELEKVKGAMTVVSSAIVPQWQKVAREPASKAGSVDGWQRIERVAPSSRSEAVDAMSWRSAGSRNVIPAVSLSTAAVSAESQRLTAMAVYYNQAAVAARLTGIASLDSSPGTADQAFEAAYLSSDFYNGK